LASAVERGVRQVVVLGAGLDTFAYRNPFGDRLRIFEVDHPATQAWKHQRLADAAIPLPDSLTYAPVDFDQDTLSGGLLAAKELESLRYPLCFMDFESVNPAIPRFAGMRPYDQIPFQWSVHVLRQPEAALQRPSKITPCKCVIPRVWNFPAGCRLKTNHHLSGCRGAVGRYFEEGVECRMYAKSSQPASGFI
jgi:hypothetical protein